LPQADREISFPITGKLDGRIYYRSRRTGKLYVRKQGKFANHPRHPQYAAIQKNIFGLKPSQGFIRDLKDYLLQYNLLPEDSIKPVQSWSNLYVKLMFALQKAYPETVDLATLTREQIVAQTYPAAR